MEFFNLIATPGLGKCKDVIKQAQTHYGQAELSINANPLNGNLFLQDFSKTFTIQGFQIDIGMVYNSQAKSPWRLNQGKTISPVEGQINEPNSVVILTDADGHENTYSYDSGRSCYVNRSEAGGCSTLTYTADNQWEGFNPATNIKELYNSNNQLVKITDSSGNDLTYAYDEGGRLKAIIGKSGNQVSIEYGLSENGLPETRIYFIEGVKKTLTMQYQFDDKNRLKKTLIPLNSNENYEINYAYDVRYGLLNNIEQSDETKASFDYEKEDNTYKLSELEDGVGNQYGVHYVENITQVTHNGAIEHTFTQNVDHLLQKHTHQEQENEYHYDADNRISAIDYKDGTTQQVRYDALGCYSEAKQRNGETHLSHRDLVTGLLLCETQVLVTQEGTRHLNTFYSYNDKQQLSFKVGPNGAVNAYTYDKNGNCICEKAYREGVFEVNALRADGRIVTENLEAWCKQQNQAAIALTEWSYNERGQKVKETIFANINPDGKGHLDESTAICEWEWDIHGKPLAKHTHLKRLNGQETPVETASETAEYDGLSRRVRGVDALKQVTRHVYHGNQQQTIFEPTGLSTTVSFDAAGNRIKQQEKAGELTNENHFTYDIAGRICIIETKNLSKEYRVYDEYNRVLFTIDAEMRATRHVYDINNRLTHQVRYSTPLENVNETILKEGKWKPTLSGKYCTESTLYDANGRLLHEINGDNFVIEHRYDSVGNRIETIAYATALNVTEVPREQIKAPLTLIESAQDRRHRYFYNQANELIGEQLPTRQVIATHRNAQGELLEKISTLGALPELTHWDSALIEKLIAETAQKKETFELDARGQCVAYTDAEKIKTTQRFDAAGRKISSTTGDKTNTVTFDALNRVIKESHRSGLEINTRYAPCGQVESETRTDTLGAASSKRDRLIRYDAFGQVTHELSPRVAAKLSDLAIANDPEKVNALWQNESIRHHYNQAGLRVSTQDELGNTTYFYYNAAEELRFSVSPLGSITEFTYDPLFKKPQITCHYAATLNAAEMKSLTGGLVTPDLITVLHSKHSIHDECETVQYNHRGLVRLVTDAEDYKTAHEYDAFNNLQATKRQIDKGEPLHRQVESQVVYDKANRPIQKTHDEGGVESLETWEYRDTENAVIHTDVNLNKTTTYFDKLNRKIKVIDALGNETGFTWDAQSRLKTTTDPMGNITTFSYENNGRTIRKTTVLSESITKKNAFGEIELEQNADGDTWQKIHDVDGQLKTEIDPEGNQTDYEYNSAGWLEKVVDPLKHVTCYEHDVSGQIEKQIEEGAGEKRILAFQRDARGREILRKDVNGIDTQTVYDKRGLEIVKVIDPGHLALLTHRKHDGLGHCIQETKSSAQGDEFVTELVRDNLGRVRQTILDPGGLKLTTQQEHDKLGKTIASTNTNQHTMRIIYDAAGRECYCIDPMGGVIGKFYDKNGLCLEERWYITPINLAELCGADLAAIEAILHSNPADKVLYHAYDAENRLTASLNNFGKLSTYQYNAQGKKTQEIQYATSLSRADFPTKTPDKSENDRQSVWFYDKNGQERFAINGEGILTEQRWNEKGWLIATRTYAKQCFNYTTCPKSEAIAHADDRETLYLHDGLGRILFEINNDGYVTLYGYDMGDKPTHTWSYPKKIALPDVITVQSIQALLPAKEEAPCVQVKYDAAYRKIAAIDELGNPEEFKLDALGNLREYVDKGGDSWLFGVDKAGRKCEESTPPVEVTTVSADGKSIKKTEKKRIVKKIEYEGDVERVTEAYDTPEARTVELHHNACNQLIKTVQDNVQVLSNEADGTAKALIKTVSKTSIMNAYQKPIVTVDEAGNVQFKVYESDRIQYEVDQEGFVTAYDYNSFGNIVRLTRYATALALDLSQFAQTGLSEADLRADLKASTDDRHVYFEYDKANRSIETRQDAVFIAIPQSEGEAQYGQYSPKKINEYNTFNEVVCERELVSPFSQELNKQWNATRKWFNKSGHVVAQLDGLNYLTQFAPDWRGNNETWVCS